MRKPRAAGSMAEQAYTRVLDKILRGEYPLGAALSRRKLGTEFGMSFLPISEAIKRLEQEGVVESLPRVGTRVRIPTAQDLRDRHILREALEVQSARLFTEKASSDERLELRAMAAHLDSLHERAATGSNSRDLLFESQMYHLSFHMRIAECTGCQALCRALAQNQVLIFNWLYDVAVDYHMPPRWHERLVEKIAGTDPDIAEAGMREHVRYGIEEIQAEIVRRFGTSAASDELKRSISAATHRGWRTKATVAR